MTTAIRPTTATKPSRLFFIDSFRLGLTVLVVLHHVAMNYGPGGPFYYLELDPDGVSKWLVIFVLVNQSWFMGAFFLLAGYFTPGSFDRKGPVGFLRARAVRLGIPLAVYMLVLNPIAIMGAFFWAEELNPLTWDDYTYTDYVRMGPMWFVALLLIFSAAYAGWRESRARLDLAVPALPTPGPMMIAAFALALAGASYLFRIWIPIGQSEYGFPSLAYLPQYASFFVIGALAYRADWFRSLPRANGRLGAAAAAAAAILVFPLAFSGEMFSLELGPALGDGLGDGHWQSAAYALWDSTFAVGLSLALVVALRSRIGSPSPFRRFLTEHAYAVYVVHIPIVVFVGVLLRDLDFDQHVKFALGAAIALPVCWAVAGLLRSIGPVRRVL